MGKGADFERVICKQLGLWWTKGERDDVFWRSQISGGRATQRMKSGKKTYGSYGDVAAVDPIGEPLLRMWTIELKCGKSHGTPWDYQESLGRGAQHPFEKTLFQAYDAHVLAESRGWMIISHRDRRSTMVFIDWYAVRDWVIKTPLSFPPCSRWRFDTGMSRFEFIGLRWDLFLERITPKLIINQI